MFFSRIFVQTETRATAPNQSSVSHDVCFVVPNDCISLVDCVLCASDVSNCDDRRHVVGNQTLAISYLIEKIFFFKESLA